LAEDHERNGKRERGAHRVREHHECATVVAIGDDPGRQAEQQPRQTLHNRDQCDEDRVASDRRSEPRVRDEADAVAEVRDRAGAEQLEVARAELAFRRSRD
jgi:hypothetical protein